MVIAHFERSCMSHDRYEQLFLSVQILVFYPVHVTQIRDSSHTAEPLVIAQNKAHPSPIILHFATHELYKFLMLEAALGRDIGPGYAIAAVRPLIGRGCMARNIGLVTESSHANFVVQKA